MAVTERERKVQERAIRLCKKYGCYVYKNAQNMYTEKGRPDLTACIPTNLENIIKVFGDNPNIGLFIGIEIKRDGHLGEVSDAQKIVGKQIKKAKGIWVAIDDTDVLEVLLMQLTEGIDGIQ